MSNKTAQAPSTQDRAEDAPSDVLEETHGDVLEASAAEAEQKNIKTEAKETPTQGADDTPSETEAPSDGSLEDAAKEEVPAAATSGKELTIVEQEPDGPKVLMVVKSLDTSQSGTSAFNMASHLAAGGIPVTVMSEGGRNLPTLLRRKVTHVEWAAPGDGPIGRMRASRRLSQAIESSGATAIHAFGRIVPGAVRSAADKRSARMIVSVPGTFDMKGWGVRGRTEAMTRADHLIVPSSYVALWLKDQFNVPEEKVSIIPPGVDFAHFNPAAVKAQRMIELARHHGIPEEDQVVLMPARLIEWKGQRTVISAFKTLDMENTTLVISGDASLDKVYAERLQHMVEKERLADKIRFIGHVEDMPALYMLSDVVIEAPTEPVAFARTSVEAQAMGRPVVTSSVGGGPEAVMEGETGWIAAPRDEEAIANALQEALSLDIDDRKRLALAARGHARDAFDLATCTARVQALYDGE
ncbi:MAG: glycosyltransferase family 4 protein [Pseudomonadota bacterium]